MRLLALVMLGVSTNLAVAQQPARPEPVGTVMGRVTCADTQRPGRLAQVKLVRVPAGADAKPGTPTGMGDMLAAGNAVETSLDGGYVIHNVKPGQYWVVVDQEGYLLPLGQFTKKELAATDDETKTRVAKAIQSFTVEANQTAREDVLLERGASVSGTVTYDDGTPASGISIQLLEKDKSGKWVSRETGRYRGFYARSSTDDNGHYRITGLPAGEYATEADLSVSDHETTTGPMPGNPTTMMTMEMQKTRFSLPLYSGDVMRRPDAKAWTLGVGEARAGTDLVFPLAKLHRVDGQVVAKDGHVINGGDVKLLYPDDRTEMTSATVGMDDQQFHMDYVPEGEFLLTVTGAKDVTKLQVANPEGYSPRFHDETKTVKTYGDAEQALSVKGDVSDVVAMVPDAGKAKATAP